MKSYEKPKLSVIAMYDVNMISASAHDNDIEDGITWNLSSL